MLRQARSIQTPLGSVVIKVVHSYFRCARQCGVPVGTMALDGQLARRRTDQCPALVGIVIVTESQLRCVHTRSTTLSPRQLKCGRREPQCI